jgi:tripartite-type tricarboxylate transporter receptor subunit TctC
MSIASRALSLFLAVSSMALPLTGQAQPGGFPKAPVYVIVPYPPGGSLDAVIRLFGEKFQKITGQTLIIENVGGAGGLIAGQRVAQAKPDGYTLLLASNGQVTLAPLLYSSLPYQPDRDLVPIVELADQEEVLYASTKSPYKTVADVIAAAKARPGAVAIASTGIGSISQLSIELLAQTGGVKFNHIPYKGAAPELQDLASGQVPLAFTFVGSAKALTAAGLVRPIAVAADKRLPSLPEVPTFAQAGVPDFQISSWMGLMGPRGMPQAAIQRLAEVANTIMKMPEFQQKMSDLSMDVRGGAPAAFQAAIQADSAKWSALAKTVNIKMQ